MWNFFLNNNFHRSVERKISWCFFSDSIILFDVFFNVWLWRRPELCQQTSTSVLGSCDLTKPPGIQKQGRVVYEYGTQQSIPKTSTKFPKSSVLQMKPSLGHMQTASLSRHNFLQKHEHEFLNVDGWIGWYGRPTGDIKTPFFLFSDLFRHEIKQQESACLLNHIQSIIQKINFFGDLRPNKCDKNNLMRVRCGKWLWDGYIYLRVIHQMKLHTTSANLAPLASRNIVCW